MSKVKTKIETRWHDHAVLNEVNIDVMVFRKIIYVLFGQNFENYVFRGIRVNTLPTKDFRALHDSKMKLSSNEKKTRQSKRIYPWSVT